MAATSSKITDKIFNDSVHGHIRLPEICVKIIDTPWFQRLRNIKQLGVGYYVYPGACHNRFEHSLGVGYLAGQMVDALRKNSGEDSISDKDKLCLQIAGLCHDLGHGPFSHTWELFLGKAGVKWRHEEASIQLFDEILKEAEVQAAFESCGLGDDKKQFIRDLIGGIPKGVRNEDKYLYEIINNKETGVDVDKWEYLLRDGLMMNIKLTFDYRRLLEFVRVVTTEDNSKHICFRDTEVRNICNMYNGRAAMHEMGYQHRVVKVVELMLVDALISADKSGYKFMGMKLTEVHTKPEVFMKITDHIFYDILLQEKEMKEASDILKRILYRNLYEYIEPEDCAEFEDEELVAVPAEISIPEEIKRIKVFGKTNPNVVKEVLNWEDYGIYQKSMLRKKVYTFRRNKGGKRKETNSAMEKSKKKRRM